ncbi:MAG: UDP-N-acetylmuramoyl-L-alanine--D-glutamate ligase [Bacteroidales bacterium]|nr:UDP-N-acetylmuramoyl-L-alanine--D-glutamate ligase [Bacteroidales bacterium]
MRYDSNNAIFRQLVVLGAGESGCGAAILAKKLGIPVFVSDSGLIKEKYKDVLLHHEIDFEEGGHRDGRTVVASLVVKSPGIPEHAPIVSACREKGVRVVSEIEFAAWFTSAKKICITGSNGKTTTTLLLGYLLKTAGFNVAVAGNVGKSFALQVAEQDVDYYVLEISSFQLDGMFDFKADIAILTNITPDHLDRYNHDFDQYAKSKFRIIQNQTADDTFIYCAEDAETIKQLKDHSINARQYTFTTGKFEGAPGAAMINNEIVIHTDKHDIHMTLEELALQGKHNVHNSMAAGIAAKLLNIRKDTIKQCLSDFQNIAHRLEYVANVHGVSYINDSKATNVNSTWYAIESMERPVVWIAGGVDKGNDYQMLKALVQKKVKAIVCLGLDNHLIHEAFKDLVKVIVDTESAAEAVFEASNLATNNDIVLLSPACASFDLFENYEDRGNQFKEAVKKL